MRNYGSTNFTSLILRGILLLIGIIVLIAVAKTVIAVTVSILTLVAIVLGIWLLIKFLSSRNRNRYY